MSKIFFVLGKSCSGKDSVFRKLKENKSLGLNTVIGYTTRPMREGETQGIEYYFVDNREMENMREQGKIIECRNYNTVLGIWSYFTADDGQINLDRGDYLYIGTLESYMQMADYFGKENVVPLYLQVEAGERLSRAISRERRQEQPGYAELCRRFLADEKDFSEKKLKEAGIIRRYNNVDLDACVEEIVGVIEEKRKFTN